MREESNDHTILSKVHTFNIPPSSNHIVANSNNSPNFSQILLHYFQTLYLAWFFHIYIFPNEYLFFQTTTHIFQLSHYSTRNIPHTLLSPYTLYFDKIGQYSPNKLIFATFHECVIKIEHNLIFQ